ncbi:MAG: hypothetical protein F6K22_20360 [Okeania sp. SIO2F4]|uniref:hypothetical protein n=1 Tax=Okeania sp. SIO2F4 TaxID=2607790 RepID=UPI0014299BFE|nr:hypothetical protein [Okeania sp. SIO2F4]NES04973.1 hypothetical protein [Okeania sp. SIO2F4]
MLALFFTTYAFTYRSFLVSEVEKLVVVHSNGRECVVCVVCVVRVGSVVRVRRN